MQHSASHGTDRASSPVTSRRTSPRSSPSGSAPLAGAAFGEPASAAAWKTKPAWGSVSINDHTINPDVERFGYKRAGITAIEIDSSHLVMLSHPQEVADLIRTAIKATAS